MGKANFAQELHNILLAIIRDYAIEGWEAVNPLPYPPHTMVDILLSEGKLLIVVTDTDGDEEARLDGLREFYTIIAALHDYLVKALFPHHQGDALDFSYYQAADFLVLVFNGRFPMVIEAIGQHVMPWVYTYYQQPKPEPLVLHQMAAQVLEATFGNPQDNTLRLGIIERVLPLRLTDLRPLKLDDPDVSVDYGAVDEPEPPEEETAPTPTITSTDDTSHDGDHDGRGPGLFDNHREKKGRTAPLPNYFRPDEPAER